jgi:flagellum-specific peptidoglycan hydrolase FlgJ
MYLGLVVVLIIFVIWRQSRSPKQILSSVIKGTPYENYLDFIYAQAKHETGNFKSTLFKRYNNSMGMGVPIYRKSYRSGEWKAPNGEIFSTYYSVTSGFKDFVEWMKYSKMPADFTTCKEYAEFMVKRNYAEDPLYYEKLVNRCENG